MGLERRGLGVGGVLGLLGGGGGGGGAQEDLVLCG